jgi:hypothetical protein
MKLSFLVLVPLILTIAAPVSATDRTIVIRPDTRYVNVQLGDVVTFVAGNKTFTLGFEDPQYWPVDLSKAGPQGIFNHPLTVYISPFRQDFGREK